jgi:hypothetical protein
MENPEAVLNTDQKEKILELWDKCGGHIGGNKYYRLHNIEEKRFWLFVESLILVANTKAVFGLEISKYPITNRDFHLDAVNMQEVAKVYIGEV